ncbi:MAG: hypothetical protein FRX49_00383 [Trebouxia sp. A1-2]|nr:MAG: hypothetical protein FRX49_00383 [Trebouxia sp. A1-2]
MQQMKRKQAHCEHAIDVVVFYKAAAVDFDLRQDVLEECWARLTSNLSRSDRSTGCVKRRPSLVTTCWMALYSTVRVRPRVWKTGPWLWPPPDRPSRSSASLRADDSTIIRGGFSGRAMPMRWCLWAHSLLLLLLLPRQGVLLGLRRGPGLMDLTGGCSLELFILQSPGKGFISTQHRLQICRAMVRAAVWVEQDTVAIAAPAEAGVAPSDVLVAAIAKTGWEWQPESCPCCQGDKSQGSPVWTGPRLPRARLPPGPAGALCQHLRLSGRHHLMPDPDVLLCLQCSTENQVIILDARVPPHSQRNTGALR